MIFNLCILAPVRDGQVVGSGMKIFPIAVPYEEGLEILDMEEAEQYAELLLRHAQEIHWPENPE